MKKLIILLAIFSLATPALAQMYRCKVNGKLIYTDKPCNGSAPPVETNVAAPETEAPLPVATQQKKLDSVTVSNLETQYFILDDEIIRMEEKLDQLKDEQEVKLALLRAKKNRANNNLAGATWEQSISEEMNAVTTFYNKRIERETILIDRKKEEREEIKKNIKQYKKVYY